MGATMKRPPRIAIVAAVLATGWGTSGQAAGRTVSGDWAPDASACTPVDGLISIGPLSLIGDELACRFRDVSRRGDVVTWHGRCGQPEPAGAATVVARLAGDSLRVTVDGRESGTYRRCPDGPASSAATKKVEAWPGEHWQADVVEVRDGHRLHATLLGRTTKTGHGDSVAITCTDRDLSTGNTIVRRHHAWALSRQGDWEGDAAELGSFGSMDGRDLRWFGATPCPAGKITWKRL